MLNSWNEMFAYHFMVNAFRAGTIVAVTAGVIGWFMVLRRQSFAGHALAVVAFPGAAAATLLGLSAGLGFFAFSTTAAVLIGIASRRGGRAVLGGFNGESAVIGTIQAFALACGLLFVGLYHGLLSGINSLLFGSFLGITDSGVVTLLIVGAASLLVLGAVGRPLLFASIDPDVALARRVPVGGLSVTFLVLLGLAAGAASQVTGALLVFALLVLPAATAQVLTANPSLSLMFTITIGLAITWSALAAAFYSSYPIGFFITSFAFATYLLALIWRSAVRQAGRKWQAAS